MACDAPFQVKRFVRDVSSSAFRCYCPSSLLLHSFSLRSVSSSRLCQRELAETRSKHVRWRCESHASAPLRDEAVGTFRLMAVWYRLPIHPSAGISDLLLDLEPHVILVRLEVPSQPFAEAKSDIDAPMVTDTSSDRKLPSKNPTG